MRESDSFFLFMGAVVGLMAAAVALAVTMAHTPQLDGGTVTELTHHERHCYPMMIGKVSTIQCRPEKWTAQIESDVEGRTLTETVRIDEATYDTTVVGDWYSRPSTSGQDSR